MSSHTTPFEVVAGRTRLAVETDGQTVTAIHLGGQAKRSAETALEHRVARELTEYFGGARRGFSFPYRAHGTVFQRRVWAALVRIPYGTTRTYGDVARSIGQPGAARAVGMANHRNPLPLVIPCHRVVAAHGVGGYGGGTDLKRRLLMLEGAALPR